MENHQPLKSACKKPHLKIKCKDEKDCTCSSKKKSHFKKVFSNKNSYSRPKKPYWFFKMKDPFSSKNPKNSYCFICKKKGHFAKICPNKLAKSSRLLHHLQTSSVISAHDDIESLFSEQESANEETIFALEETDTNSDSNSEKVQIIDMVHILRASVAQSSISIPSISVHILPAKFHKPISVIGFIDTGAQKSMLHPTILPPNCWVKHIEIFRAADSQIFQTSLITKAPIGVQFFQIVSYGQRLLAQSFQIRIY